MKVVIVSNYFNHHQKPVSDELYNETKSEFRFIATEKMDEERINLGWKMNSFPKYVIEVIDKASELEAIDIINKADIVIWGDAPLRFLKKRLKAGKLTFRNTERIFKKGNSWKEILPRKIKHYILNYMCKNGYLLCSSAYAAQDYKKIKCYENRTFAWGYFPETKKYDIRKLMEEKKGEKRTILWAARLIEWKHPEFAVEVAYMLKHEGYDFTLNMIGCGELENKIQEMIMKYHLEDTVNLLGSMSQERVREYMEKSEIFLFTSDHNEGWGAVLNESMNSGCAVVANNEIGSVPYLIENGKNGLVYQNNNFNNLYGCLKILLDDEKFREKLGINAYQTIQETWNAKNAVHQLFKLVDIINRDKNFDDICWGPCAIDNGSIYERVTNQSDIC